MTKHSLQRVVSICVTCAAALATIGCATFEIPDPPVEDVAPRRTERLERGAASFEQQHADAQFQAALSAWRNGDPAGCQQLLEKLLADAPNHLSGRLLLADLYLESNQLEAAEQNLLTLVQQYPHAAQVHHSLGLLCGELNRPQDSFFHLQRAVEIAPENRVYRETLALFAE
jgi:predicted Zn-dependent protease